MEYIEVKDGLLNINIKVNIKRVWQFTPKTTYHTEFAKANNIDTENIEDTIQTDILYQNRKIFDERLEYLIKRDSGKLILSEKEIIDQKQEILYAVCYLQKLFISSNLKELESDDFKIFTNIVNMNKELGNIDRGTKFKLSLSIATKTNLNSIELPIACDSSEFYSYLCNAVYQYFKANAKTFRLNWYLQNAYKEDLTPPILQRYLEQIEGRKAPHPNTIFGLYMYTMLPYLVKRPQFQPSIRNNSILTESQGRFFDGFFRLFGFYDQSFKTLLTDKGQAMTAKELRIILNRYIDNYNLSTKFPPKSSPKIA